MSSYYNKIQLSLDYIEEHIKEDIKLEDLAELSHYSVHHFHRLFQSVVGLPVKDYIRKRKLATSAVDIINSNKNIVDIALTYGFNSHETYSRAFKRIFDLTPNAYRKANKNSIPKDFWKVSFKDNDLKNRYIKAVETLIDRLKQDQNILAVIVMGSLSYDKVWEKSDIDLTIIVNDNCKLNPNICLIEDDIYINGNTLTRTEFKKDLAKSSKASMLHSYYSLGTMMYCNDDSLKELYETTFSLDIGERDKHYALLERTEWVLWRLLKAEKWLKVKSDVRYAYLWLTDLLKPLAAIEVLLNDNIPSREVIQQALKYKNPIIEKLYIGLMDEKKNSINISEAIEMVYEYLEDHLEIICKPILDYFDNVNDMKPLSTIVNDFNNTLKASLLCEICEWLCEEGILVKDKVETHISLKSNTTVFEPAYFKSDINQDLVF